MITLTIEAESLTDLRNKIVALATEEPGWSAGVSVKEEPRKRGRPPKEEPVEPAPVEPITDEEPDQVEEAETVPADAIANEKMKQEVVATLSDMYTAGKVKFVRGLLAKYGDGAKTFHEIDASVFPAIKEAMKGEAA